MRLRLRIALRAMNRKRSDGEMHRRKGVYALIIANSRDVNIEIGGRMMRFRRGYYAYIGSALSGLDRRIQRHLRDEKKMHWHIDFMLAAQSVGIVSVFIGETEERKECEIAAHMLASGMEPLNGFGCSDCSCRSHLFFSPHLNTLVSAVRSSFIAAGLSSISQQQPRRSHTHAAEITSDEEMMEEWKKIDGRDDAQLRG